MNLIKNFPSEAKVVSILLKAFIIVKIPGYEFISTLISTIKLAEKAVIRPNFFLIFGLKFLQFYNLLA